jgi:uncharacterized phiE125 gp8 family phage protein
MIYRLEVAGGIAQALPAPVAKQHLRVDHTLDDEYIDALILAAQAQVEEMYLWQSLTPRTYRLSTDGVATEIALPMGPVVSVASVTARTATGAGTVLAESAWRLAWREPGRLEVTEWPADCVSLEVEYDAGMAAVPAWATQAILLLVGHWYEHREAVDVRPGAGALEIPFGVQALLLGRRAW